MKSKKSSLRAALFLALIGAAFAFTACWQGIPVGSGGNSESGIEGITWKSETTAATITLRLKSGHVKATVTAAGQTVPDNGTYTVSGDTIQFTGFTLATYLNREFKYKVENGTFEMWTDGLTYKFKKA